jgi:hypothetical protein
MALVDVYVHVYVYVDVDVDVDVDARGGQILGAPWTGAPGGRA